MVPKTTRSIFISADQTLQTAKQGLDDYLGRDPKRRETGLRNFIVFSRAVSNVIQNLRSTVGRDKFDSWYEPWQTKMKNDCVMKEIYKMRSKILKEGILEVEVTTKIEYLNTSDIQDLLEEAPPYASGFFIGDRLGGSGWEISMPDGTIEKYYVELPSKIKVDTNIEINNLPKIPIEGKEGYFYSTKDMLKNYYEFLVVFVSDAKLHFIG